MDNTMSRILYKKIFLIIAVIFISFVVFKSAHDHGTFSNEHQHKQSEQNSKTNYAMADSAMEVEQIHSAMKVDRSVRHPTFNVSYLRNRCSQSYRTKLTNDSVDLRVFVFTFNRAASVKRLLASLNTAQYGTSVVSLEVWIDRSVEGKVDEETLKTVEGFKFDHGIFRVCVHEKHVGILGQWLIPWKPKADSKEIAVLFEDDITVSPYVFTYLKVVHSKYRHMPKVNGFSLQGVSMKHNGADGNVDIPSTNKVYLYPTLGTWGFSPNTKNWIHFLQWFEKTYDDIQFEPRVPNHVGTTWYQAFMNKQKEDGFWEMWFIYHSWYEQEWTLYPNFPDHKGLTFNWKENGLHYQGQSVKVENEDKKHLLLEWKPEFESLPEVPLYVDNGGRQTLPDDKVL